jgi:hypothetical protein
LYRYLDKCKEKALYCNTGSVFYIQKANEPHLFECGDKLGDITNELKPGQYIEDFVSGGHENYNTLISAIKKIPSVRYVG